MTLKTYPELEQGTEAWHDVRRGIVTASVVGRLVTTKTIKPASNDDSRALTDLLVAERITGRTHPTYMNDDMWRGVLAEPVARDAYAEHYGVGVTTVGFMLRTEDDWTLGYSPDGLVGDDGLLEVKAPRAKGHLRTILTDEVPLGYMAQLQAGLLVTGRNWIDFVSFCGGMPLYVKRVFPDPAWQVALIEAVTQFEDNAAAMTKHYAERTKGLATTEPIDMELEISA